LKKLSFLVFAVLLISTVSSFAQNSFEDALKKAKNENKRVIVDVYTDWCGWCKKMDGEAYSNSDIKKIIEENFVLVKLNAEGTGKIKYNGKDYTETDLATYFEATGYPTTIFLEPDGKVIEFKYDKQPMKIVPGYFKTDEFKKILEFFKNGKYKDTDMSTIV